MDPARSDHNHHKNAVIAGSLPSQRDGYATTNAPNDPNTTKNRPPNRAPPRERLAIVPGHQPGLTTNMTRNEKPWTLAPPP